jgi:trehalose 6-phosphate phosphatase
VTAPRFGLVSDVDGTLSPIVDDPDAAQVTPRNRELLAALHQELALVALVSGRGAADVAARVGLPELIYVGNHGLERWAEGQAQVLPEAAAYRPQLVATKAKLEALIEPGAALEDKGASLTLHYRRHAQPALYANQHMPAFERIAQSQGLKLSTGRMVFEFKPPIEVDKGSSLRRLAAAHNLDAALYIGDDTTDIAALQAARSLRIEGACDAWGVGVQSEETPEGVAATADFSASSVSDVEALLAWLLMARRASST